MKSSQKTGIHGLVALSMLALLALPGCNTSTEPAVPAQEPAPLATAAATALAGPYVAIQTYPVPSGNFYLTDHSQFKHNTTLDWASWGRGGIPDYNHKSGITPKIGDYTLIGAPTVRRFLSPLSPTRFSWAQGTPVASANDVGTGLYVNGQGKGFQITYEANDIGRNVLLFVGVSRAKGKLTAKLSDGSVPLVQDLSLSNSTGTTWGEYQIQYNAAVPTGTKLIVTWTLEQDFASGSGALLLQSTLVDPINRSPTMSLVSYNSGANPSDRVWAPGMTERVRATVSDPDGTPITDVSYYDYHNTLIRQGVPSPYDITIGNFAYGETKLIYGIATESIGGKGRSLNLPIKAWVRTIYPGQPAIPDNNPAGVSLPLTIPFMGLANQTYDVEVTVNVKHTFIGDLQVYLTDPSGREQALVLNRGGSSHDFSLNLSDSYSQAISTATDLSGMFYRPESSFNAAHAGYQASGTWILKVVDCLPLDAGYVSEFNLRLTAL